MRPLSALAASVSAKGAALTRGLARKRRLALGLGAVGLNFYLPAWFHGGIVTWASKGACVPALNCYSCPSAVGACPMGALQHSMASLRFNLSVAQYQLGLYVIGFFGLVGGFAGRLTCGWICPFGLVQEGLHKIPTPKLGVPRFLSSMRYMVLGALVLALPFFILDQFGYGQTWFCKWLCPAGTLEAGVPLVLLNSGVRAQIGLLYAWKIGVLILFLGWMVVSLRPFCRTTCPLGAILGLFNKVSMFRLRLEEARCTSCGNCEQACPIDVRVRQSPNSPGCIRCLKCISACKEGCLTYEFSRKRPSGETLNSEQEAPGAVSM